MISFKKNGRPTKSEKGILKNINNFLSSLTESQESEYDFKGETVTEGSRLSEIWDGIQTKNPPNTESKENIDFDTGEILESKKNTDKDINFGNENKKMEDAVILEEETNEGNEGAGNKSEGSDNVGVPDSFSPLSRPIHERSYNREQQISVGNIDEPDFGQQSTPREEIQGIEQEQEEKEKEEIEGEKKEREKACDKTKNEHLEDLSDSEKKFASKQLVQTVLDAYEMLHEVGKSYVKYPEDKLQEKIMKGEIDPTMEIPVDEMGTTTNPIDFFTEFNETATEALSYDPEFGEKIRPAMEREFSKRGWGLTDLQFIGIAFAKDITYKTVQIVALKKTASSIMETFVQMQQDKKDYVASQTQYEKHSPDSYVTPPPSEPAPNPIYQHPHEEAEDAEDVEEEAYQTADENED